MSGRSEARRHLAGCIALRTRRRAPRFAVALLALLALRVALVPPPLRRVPPPTPAADESTWRGWRDTLECAHRLRRDGDVLGALVLYERVRSSPSARVQDRDRASYWSARMRLERAEGSAAVALHAVLHRSLEPMLIARTGILAARALGGATHDVEARWLAATVRDAYLLLRSMSKVMSRRGERARAWLDHYQRSDARHFLR